MLLLNLAALFYYKYTNFFIDQVSQVLVNLGLGKLENKKILLPVGISFLTFHKISYAVDVYRGISQPAKSFIEYLLYISFFPQLIAGPIIRFHDIEHQLNVRQFTSQRVFDGLYRFSVGFAQKILIADSLAVVVDKIFSFDQNTLTTAWAWFGIVAYSLQIYFDFSGYSSMAIGLACIFGFDFLENFNRPYSSLSVTEFWRRWHISLSRWMKDYLYVPLGGSRVSRVKTYRNLFLVFLISGFWHGASWNFVVWGFIHGLFVVLDKLFLDKLLDKAPIVIRAMLTYFVVLIAWVFFRCDTLAGSFNYLSRMFMYVDYQDLGKHVPRALVVQNSSLFAFIFGFLVCFSYLFLPKRVMQALSRLGAAFSESSSFKFVLILFLLILSSVTLATDSYKAFIYFRF